MIPFSGKRREYTFSSGRTIHAYCGIIGISDELELTDGYDGSIDWPSKQYTEADMRELSDMMIERWRKFKETL